MNWTITTHSSSTGILNNNSSKAVLKRYTAATRKRIAAAARQRAEAKKIRNPATPMERGKAFLNYFRQWLQRIFASMRLQYSDFCLHIPDAFKVAYSKAKELISSLFTYRRKRAAHTLAKSVCAILVILGISTAGYSTITYIDTDETPAAHYHNHRTEHRMQNQQSVAYYPVTSNQSRRTINGIAEGRPGDNAAMEIFAGESGNEPATEDETDNENTTPIADDAATATANEINNENINENTSESTAGIAPDNTSASTANPTPENTAAPTAGSTPENTTGAPAGSTPENTAGAEGIVTETAFLSLGAGNSENVLVQEGKRYYTTEELRRGLLRGLVDLAPAFVAAQEEHGVDAVFLAAIAALESGWGSYPIHGTNLFGFGSMRFESREAGIDHVARFLKRAYLTEGGQYYRGVSVVSVGYYYCPPSRDWPVKINQIMREIIRRIEQNNEQNT